MIQFRDALKLHHFEEKIFFQFCSKIGLIFVCAIFEARMAPDKHTFVKRTMPSGQSYKASTIVIYHPRDIPDLKIPHITTLDL